MKTYMFRDALWCTGVVIGIMAAFVFGLVWLNDGFNVDREIYRARQDVIDYVDYTANKQMGYIKTLRNDIMSSSFKGRK